MPTWPASLPQDISSQNYKETPPNTIIRSTVEVGIAKQRSRTTGAARPISATLLLTLDQVETLDDFYENDLGFGALSFDWKHPRTDVPSTFRFTDTPSYPAASSVTFRVTLPLEILP